MPWAGQGRVHYGVLETCARAAERAWGFGGVGTETVILPDLSLKIAIWVADHAEVHA